MADVIRVGDMVETAIYVGKKRVPIGTGRVVAIHSGYCDVDHCYPHGNPWIYAETNGTMRKIEKEGKVKP
jgi:hypothetical protein